MEMLLLTVETHHLDDVCQINVVRIRVRQYQLKYYRQ